MPFCNLETFFCSGDFNQYDGGDDCLNACHADAGGYPGYTYRPGDTETPGVTQSISQHGTLNCRMYHLEAAIDPRQWSREQGDALPAHLAAELSGFLRLPVVNWFPSDADVRRQRVSAGRTGPAGRGA